MSGGPGASLRPAHPFTIIAEPDVVRLVAGEDARYTLSAPGLDQWLPPLFADLSAAVPVEGALARVPEAHKKAARGLIERLRGERVLIPPPLTEAPPRAFPRLVLSGENELAAALRRALLSGDERPSAGELRVLCQDTLDYESALRHGALAIAEGAASLWVTEAPLARAFVSPVFLPDAGPCLACLIESFKRLSPSPELYASLLHHGQRGGSFAPTSIGRDARSALAAIASWKAAALADPPAAWPEALFRLHVLDVKSFEVSSHPVAVDPDCPSGHHSL